MATSLAKTRGQPMVSGLNLVFLCPNGVLHKYHCYRLSEAPADSVKCVYTVALQQQHVIRGFIKISAKFHPGPLSAP